MSKQPRMTLAQARSLLQAGRKTYRRHKPGLLRALLPLGVGLAVSERAWGWNLMDYIVNGKWQELATRAVPRALTGYDTATGVWDPWRAVTNFYFPAYLTDRGLRWVNQRFLNNKGLTVMGIRLL